MKSFVKTMFTATAPRKVQGKRKKKKTTGTIFTSKIGSAIL